MPANRFAPDRIVRGHEQDARVIDRILQAILARWPIRKCDVESVYSAAIDWSDGATVPTENINVDEIFNSATGIARALGCMDFINGLEVNYVDSSSISVSPGHLLHRGDFKELECDAANSDVPFEVAANTVLDADCPSVEGNPSGLDSDKWYYVYANMDASGSAPPIADFIRICDTAPVKCEAKGWEKPDDTAWRFIGSIRTMDNGEIRPFDRRNNGWVMWRTATAATDWVAAGYGRDATQTNFTTGGPIRYEAGATGVDYHDGDKHIPPSADLAMVSADERNASADIIVKSIGDPGGGYVLTEGPENQSQNVIVAVNADGADPADKQTFYIECSSSSGGFDVIGYHERIQ